MGLRHAVVTSVNRDDLPDGGAAHIAATIREIRRLNQTRRVAIHCVAVGFDSALMKNLAAENGGRELRSSKRRTPKAQMSVAGLLPLVLHSSGAI